jgi:hypothetical protein
VYKPEEMLSKLLQLPGCSQRNISLVKLNEKGTKP